MTQSVQVLATILFMGAILHIFSVGRIRRFAQKTKDGSVLSAFLHLMGEIEIVFGIWATVFVAAFALLEGPTRTIYYIEHVDFTGAVFVFVVMVMASTRSILRLASRGISEVAALISRTIPGFHVAKAYFAVVLILGPLLGSLITEPAAMTVSALLLRDRFFQTDVSVRFKYKTLALLFVNISIGGLLTNFAAPPVVMVAKTWRWDTPFMFENFGYKAALAVIANTVFTLFLLRPDFKKMERHVPPTPKTELPPLWIVLAHVFFLTAVIYIGQYASTILGVFLIFVSFVKVTNQYQDRLQTREALLVGFFLAGLVLLGKPQSWWLTPLVTGLERYPLFIGSTLLTAITDNAALTYIGSQVPNLSPLLRYSLVAGAVTGGGLTVIANAPNPAGYGILKESFGAEGIRPMRLFQAALIPTVITALFLELL